MLSKYTAEFNKLRALYADSIAGHVLVLKADGDGVRWFRLQKESGGLALSTDIVFLGGERTIITGDYCPRSCRNGAISDIGYGLGWFARPQGQEYLCQKFLGKGWVRSAAADHFDSVVENELGEDGGGHAEAMRLALEDSSWMTESPFDNLHAWENAFGAVISNAGWDSETAYPSNDYAVEDAAMLCALQRRFSDLFRSTWCVSKDGSLRPKLREVV